MNEKEYINHLKEEKKKKKEKLLWALFGGVFLFLILYALRYLVVIDLFNYSPPGVSSYLLNTLFYEFSNVELKTLINKHSTPNWLYPSLLLIYWGYQLITLVILITPIFFVEWKRKKSKNSFKNELTKISEILDLINSKKNRESNKWHKQFEKKAQKLKLVQAISPLRPKWYSIVSTRWFSFSELPNDIKKVHISLNKFPEALEEASQKGFNLRQFNKSLNLLKSFFLVVASKYDPILDKPFRYREKSEKEILKEFSDSSRSLILKVINHPSIKNDSLLNKLKSSVNKIVNDPLVIQATKVSLVGGFVMTFGVLLFGIKLNQAFLAWFSVSFGAISISIGISAYGDNKG